MSSFSDKRLRLGAGGRGGKSGGGDGRSVGDEGIAGVVDDEREGIAGGTGGGRPRGSKMLATLYLDFEGPGPPY